jgi:hypothetical protein
MCARWALSPPSVIARGRSEGNCEFERTTEWTKRRFVIPIIGENAPSTRETKQSVHPTQKTADCA